MTLLTCLQSTVHLLVFHTIHTQEGHHIFIKNKTAASRCSAGSEDFLKAYEEFNSLNLEAERPVEPWMAAASDQLPLAISNSDQAALIAQWG